MNEQEITSLLKEHETSLIGRSEWEAIWSDIADHFLPKSSGGWRNGEITTPKFRVDTNKRFSSNPVISLQRFTGIVDGLLTPVSQEWHNLRPKDPRLKDNKAVRDWFFQVNSLLFDYRNNPASNFGGQNSARWEQMGAFGTGVLFIDYDPKETLRYKCLDIKNLSFRENHQGVIDTVFRKYALTASQASGQFGEKNISDAMKQLLKSDEGNTRKFSILHIVKPNPMKGVIKNGVEGKEYLSYYVDVSEKILLESGGYDTFPYSISRYSLAPDDILGRSPAMSALADVKMLNAMARAINVNTRTALEPTLLIGDDGMLNGSPTLNMTPNSVIVGGLDENGNSRIKPFQDGSRIDITQGMVDKLEDNIKDIFLITLFQIMVETPRMTATEALIRSQEKSMLLTPLIAKQQNEALHPMIVRELDLLLRNDKLPPMPAELQEGGGVYSIIFDSPVNKMQKSEQLVGLNKALEILLPLAQQDPAMLDVIDKDKLTELAMTISGVPSVVLKDAKELKQQRAEQQQNQQNQQDQQSAVESSEIIKTLAQAQAQGQ